MREIKRDTAAGSCEARLARLAESITRRSGRNTHIYYCPDKTYSYMFEVVERVDDYGETCTLPACFNTYIEAAAYLAGYARALVEIKKGAL